MPGKTDVFRIVFNDGENHQAIVFQEPVQGKDYHADEVWVLPGATAAPVNDEGNIPHREPSGVEGENLGITWHFQK
jgi:hypothetical protein